MNNEDWISLHRKFKNWKWYKDINTKTLFLHLLLIANYKDNYWKNILVKRGQLITSIEHLATETGLTIQQTRTAIKKLKSTNEITVTTTNKYTVISIEKYGIYQKNNREITNKVTEKITNEQQTNNKQITTNNKDNNIYLFLFNKYKEQIEKEPRRTVQIISAMKNSSEYELLTLDEQDKIFYDLMSIDKKIR